MREDFVRPAGQGSRWGAERLKAGDLWNVEAVSLRQGGFG